MLSMHHMGDHTEDDRNIIHKMLLSSAELFLLTVNKLPVDQLFLTKTWTPAVTAGVLLKLFGVEVAVRHVGQAFLYLMTVQGNPLESQVSDMVKGMYRPQDARPKLSVVKGGKR